jgi:hypothetical protein
MTYGNENNYFVVGFEVFTAVVIKGIIFWNMTPHSPLSFNRCFGGTYRLHLQAACLLVAEPISSTLKMEAICSSETSVETQRNTRRHIPEDDALQLLCYSVCLRQGGADGYLS